MKKIIYAIITCSLGILIDSSALAEGCASLVNTTWTGQAQLITPAIVPINATITSVVKVTNGFFDLKGTINGEVMSSMFGCTEINPGQIQQITLQSNSNSVGSSILLPNARNPSQLQWLSGRLQGSYIDTTSDANKNYLNKTN